MRTLGKDEPAAIVFAKLVPDGDGVQRLVSANLATADGHLLPTLSAALLARAPAPAMPESLLLAPPAPFETIPTYRLIDVLRCVEQRPAAIKEALSGKVVLIGSNLPEEDRNAPRTGSCGSLPPRRARAPIAHSAGSVPPMLKARRPLAYSSTRRRCSR